MLATADEALGLLAYTNVRPLLIIMVLLRI